MTDPIYYIEREAEIRVNGSSVTFIGAGAAGLEAGLSELYRGVNGLGAVSLKFLAKGNVFSTIVTSGVEVVIGDGEVTVAGQTFDAAATALITAAILAPLGIATMNVAAAVGISAVTGAAVSAVYSIFVEDTVDQIIDTLSGTVDTDIQLKNSNGDILSGVLYKDGLESFETPGAVEELLKSPISTPEYPIASYNDTIEIFKGSNDTPWEVFKIYDPDLIKNALKLFFNDNIDNFENLGNNGGTGNNDRYFVNIPNENGSADLLYARTVENGQQITDFSKASDQIELITNFYETADDNQTLSVHPELIAFHDSNGDFHGSLDPNNQWLVYLGNDNNNSVLFANHNDNILFGGAGEDKLTGDKGQDFLYGGLDDDILIATSGSRGLEQDFYHGGNYGDNNNNGYDTIDYSNITFGIMLKWDDYTGPATISAFDNQGNPTEKADELVSIEKYLLTNTTDIVKVQDNQDNIVHVDAQDGQDIVDFTALSYGIDYNLNDGIVTSTSLPNESKFLNFQNILATGYDDYLRDSTGTQKYFGFNGLDIIDYTSNAHRIVVSHNLNIVNNLNTYVWEKDYLEDIEGFVAGDGNDYFYAREGVQQASYVGEGNTSYIDSNGLTVLGRDIVDFSYHDGNADDLIGPPNPNASAGIDLSMEGFLGYVEDTSGGTFGLQGIEQVIATNGNDIINAQGGSYWFFGMNGQDIINTGNGNDHLSGGGDHDILNGGGGNDTYYFGWLGGGGIDQISDSSGSDKAYFMESHIFNPGAYFRNTATGKFEINGIANIDTDSNGVAVIETVEFVDRASFNTAGLGLIFSQDIEGTNGIEPDIATTGDDNITGSGNDDFLSGEEGNDTLTGSGGNDLLQGGDGADTLNGGAGHDALYANTQSNNSDDGENDTLNGGNGNDFLYGSGGGDQLNGGDGYDYLSGKSGDFLFGDNGEDKLYGSGNVILDGGHDNDYLSGSGAGVDYIFSQGTDVIFDQGSSSRLNFLETSLANLTFGRAANDSLVITDISGDRAIILNHFGNNPLEFLNFGAGDILLSTIDGDIVFFTPSINDGAGANLYPERTYTGGSENNTYFSTGAEDTVDVGLGQNNITFAPIDLGSRVFLFTTPDAEQDIIKYTTIDSLDDLELTYENGVMQLIGGLDEVIINGATENGQSDHIKVQVGNGQLVEEATLQQLDLTIIGSASGDLNGYSIDDVMIADENGSIIDGLTGDDHITGLSGDDTLSGGEGNDIILNGDGNDIITGGDGADELIDQGGDDTFYVDVSDTLYSGAGSNTIILDWDSEDEQNGILYSLTGFEIVIDNEDDLENLIFTRSFSVDQNGEINGTDDSYTLHYAGNNIVIEDYEELVGAPTITLASNNDQELLSNFQLLTDLSEYSDGEIISEGALQFEHNDLFYGTSGADTLSFTGGIDTIYGGDGNDNIQKTDSFYLDDNLNLITVPHTATDVIFAYGEAGDDLLFGGLGNDVLDGGIGNDFLNGKGGNNTLLGGAGDDILYPGSSGDNTIDGGEGSDTISFDPNVMSTVDSLTVDLGLGTVTSASGTITLTSIENVEGSANYDHIIGDDQNNILSAYSGNDLLEGKGGDDTYRIPYSGGMTIKETEGYDVIEAPLTIAQAQPQITITLSGFDMLIDTGVGVYTIKDQFGADPGTRVEAIQFTDGTLDLINYTSWYTVDTGGQAITASGTETSEPIIGTEGLVDTIDYSLSTASLTVDLEVGIGTGGYADGDTYFSIEDVIGSAYNDIITGSAELNNLYGGNGDDILSGGAGDDYLEGGSGNDIYIFNIGDGVNTILETSGFDSLSLGVGITFGDLTFNQNGNDLEINIASGFVIKDFYSGDPDKVVEQITFDNGSTFDLTTLLTTTPESAEAINTASTGFHSYHSSQDADGTINTIESATGVELNGNAWKRIALDYTLTTDTVISFEYKSTISGEMHGFGLETDNDYTTGAASYQLDGTEYPSNFMTNYAYTGAGDWQHFSINVGAHQTGDVDWLTFINDHDNGLQDANSYYRNIVLYEREAGTINVAPQAVVDEFEGLINTAIMGNLFADNFHGLDFDVDNTALNAVAETITTTNGSVTISANGDFTYTPDTDFSGTDSFNYTLEDGNGGSDTATATLFVSTADADDTFTTSSAYEFYNGGAGVDLVDYSTSSTRVKLNLGAGIGWDGDANDDTYVHIENVIGTDIAGDRDFIYGSEVSNYIWGLAGNDQLEGMEGADTIDGGAGSDYSNYTRSDAGVTVNLKTNVHTGGHAEGDDLISIENITGSDYADHITGSDGGNKLYAESGDDIIYGGAGSDTMYGGYGADTFVFGATDSIGYIDTIDDFSTSQGDMLDLSDLISAYDPVTDAITDFIQITDSGSNSIVSVDIDGGADNFVQIATLNDITGLTDEAALETSGNLITI